MDNNEQTSHPSHLLLTPLMISLIGILSTAVAILLYNFIVTRYCAARQVLGFQQTENRTGVEEKALQSIPVLPYRVEDGGLFSVEQTECSVCLCEFEEGEVLRLLPNCQHAFHIGCIDQWLFSHTNCPLCRASIVVSSELSLLVEADSEQSTANNEQGGNSEGGREGNRVLIHSPSGVLLGEGKLKSLQGEHENILSLDITYIAIKIQRDTERDSSQPSSSSSTLLRTVAASPRHGSPKPLEIMSSMVMKSYSRLRLDQGNTTQEGIIPR